jgi:rubrerythrin
VTNAAAIAAKLRSNLRFKLAYIRVYRDFQQAITEDEVKALLMTLADDEREGIGSLARRIRQLGGMVQPESQPGRSAQELRIKASTQRTTLAKLRFLQRGATRAIEWYDEQIAALADDEETVVLLKALQEDKRQHVQRLETMIAGLGG